MHSLIRHSLFALRAKLNSHMRKSEIKYKLNYDICVKIRPRIFPKIMSSLTAAYVRESKNRQPSCKLDRYTTTYHREPPTTLWW